MCYVTQKFQCTLRFKVRGNWRGYAVLNEDVLVARHRVKGMTLGPLLGK
jgi:hypothetical protein